MPAALRVNWPKQVLTKGNQCPPTAAGKETEVADANETTRQHMQQKAT